MFFTPLLPGGVIGTDTGTLRKQVKVKRKTQPNQSMTIDWSNPIANGLIFAYNGVTNTDLVKGARGDQQNIAVDSIGQGTNITGSADVVTISARNNTPVTNNLSFFSLFTTTTSPDAQSATNNYTSLFCKRDSINPERISFYFAGGRLHIVANDSLGVSQQIQLSGDITSIGRTTACATGSINGSVGYINGKQTGTGIATYWPAGTSTWKIGLGRADAPTETLISVHHLDLCWNRTLTPAEVASLDANPWQLFKSTPQTMVATRGIVSRPNSDLSVTNNTITIRRQVKVKRKTQPQTVPKLKSQYATWEWVYVPSAGIKNIGSAKIDGVFTGSAGYGGSTKAGKAYSLGASASSSLRLGDTTCKFVQTKPVSGLIVFTRPSSGAMQPLFRASTNGTGLYVKVNNSNQIEIDTTFSTFILGSTNLVKTGDINVVAFCIEPRIADGGTGRISLALNGVLTTGTWTSSPNFTGSSDFGSSPEGFSANRQMLSAATTKSISNEELVTLSLNPWQIFESTPQTMVYTKLGGSGWSYNSNTSLYDAIDEPSYNDTDAIISPSLSATPGPAKFGLDTSLDAGTYNVNVRARKTDTTGDIRATLIDSAGNVVGTSSWQTLTAIYQTYVLSVTTTATASRVGLEVRA